jgi:O-methyltransferase involved in polyketide biosynthesis
MRVNLIIVRPVGNEERKMSISKTAFGVAYQRYYHLKYDTPPYILSDDVVESLLDNRTKLKIAEYRDKFELPSALGLRSNVLVRSRFAEDEIFNAIKNGASQVVILGAGLDTSCLRLAR